MYLCYKTPAAANYEGWKKRAIPLGNGSIGARVFGGVQREMIQFNEKTLFSGDENKIGSFQNFGELFLTFDNKVPCSENTYLRDLDLETGSAMVACQKGLDGHTRHYFISAADNVLVGKLESTGDTMLEFTLSLQSEQNGKVYYEGAYAYIEGTVNANNGVGNESGEDKNDLRYICCVKVIPDDGELVTTEEGISVSDTFGARIVMSCATSYYGEDELEKCRERVESASSLTFPQLFRRHLDSYKKIMGGAKLNICQSDENLTTDSQLKIYSKGRNKQNLEALLYEMGKYIIAASFGKSTLPMTECGIWNSVNVQENGEILINTSALYDALVVMKKAGMDEFAELTETYISENNDKVRCNPFGKKIPAPQISAKKQNAISKLFGKGNPQSGLVSLFDEFSDYIDKPNSKGAYKCIGSIISKTNDNLIMDDISHNIAFTGSVIRMLIDKGADSTVSFLPCLPAEWNIGSLSSVFMDGNEFSIEWSDGKFTKGSIISHKDCEIRFCAHGKFIGVSDENGNDVEEKFENGVVSFIAQKDKKYTLY